MLWEVIILIKLIIIQLLLKLKFVSKDIQKINLERIEKIRLFNPPIVNINKNPVDHKIIGEFILYPLIVISHLKILIPVGIP